MKRWRKSLAAALCLCAAMGLLAGCGGSDKNGIHDYNSARSGVAVVADILELDGIPYGYSQGTGFFIGREGENPQYLVTNYHVVSDYLEYGSGEKFETTIDGEKYIAQDYINVYYDSDDYTEAYVVVYDANADLAVLRLDQPTEERQPLKLRAPEDSMVGDTVYALGFPGNSDNEGFEPSSKWGLSDVSITKGTISRLVTTSGTGSRWIQTDSTLQHGNSGGPLVTEDGVVIGICQGGYASMTDYNVLDIESTNYAVDIRAAMELMDSNNIVYVLDDGSEAPNPALIAAAAAVILLIAAAVLLLWKKKSPQPAPVQTPVSGPARAAVSETQPVQPAPVPAAAPANAGVADDSGFRIQGTAGALNGKRLMIRNNAALTLGRNSEKCNVAFPVTTPGVSEVHCAVWVSGGRVYIKDLGSSHGTFIAPGQKLSASQTIELKPGDSFYLGTPQQSFIVAVKGGH